LPPCLKMILISCPSRARLVFDDVNEIGRCSDPKISSMTPLKNGGAKWGSFQGFIFWFLVETIRRTHMFLIFFGGISLLLSAGQVYHLFSIIGSRTATVEGLEKQAALSGSKSLQRLQIHALRLYPSYRRHDLS
jgi:hypothetical protein